ncbi:MAG TPA: DUF5996 family protein [Acidobacteriaceae bacterium]|nr:DUF5996 family protein [Acidobacteriaceae bacterium]
MPEKNDSLRSAWPELAWEQWKATQATLHMLTQIVGKTRLALTPLQNHWWNVPLYVSARGLTTSAMPWRGRELEIEFDLRQHVLEIRGVSESNVVLPLENLSVADFYAEYLEILAELGIEARIWPMPVEVADPIRFDRDTEHTLYDRDAVERFHQVLMRVDAVLRRFATGFQGKISPVHFFWGSFDLCVTRFSGRKASGPPRPDKIQQEAYSHEVISAGWWPGNGGYGKPAFYCYAAPVPEGLREKQVSPGTWDPALGEFLLSYDEVRAAPDPEATLLAFLESTYAACADAAHWDRAALERPIATPPCR